MALEERRVSLCTMERDTGRLARIKAWAGSLSTADKATLLLIEHNGINARRNEVWSLEMRRAKDLIEETGGDPEWWIEFYNVIEPAAPDPDSTVLFTATLEVEQQITYRL